MSWKKWCRWAPIIELDINLKDSDQCLKIWIEQNIKYHVSQSGILWNYVDVKSYLTLQHGQKSLEAKVMKHPVSNTDFQTTAHPLSTPFQRCRFHHAQSKRSWSPGGSVLAGLRRQAAPVPRCEGVNLQPRFSPSPWFPWGPLSPRGSGLLGLEALTTNRIPRTESGRRAQVVTKGCGHPQISTHLFIPQCLLNASVHLPELTSRYGRTGETSNSPPCRYRKASPPSLVRDNPGWNPGGCVTLGSLLSLSVPQFPLL